MNLPTDWTPGAIALGVATTIGIFAALRLRGSGGKAAPGPAADERLADLHRQRDAQYEQIRALDADPNWRADDKAAERHRLVLDAARTLHALATTAAPVAPSTTPPSRSNPWVSAVVGLSAGVFGALLVLGIQDYTKEKPAMDAPMGGGGPMAGAGATGGGTPMDDNAAEIAAAKAAADAAPDDAHAQLVYARTLLDGNDVKGAFDATQKVTTKDPDNADARTLQAVILLQIGDEKMATSLLDKVIAMHPDAVEALGYRGAVYLNDGDKDNAIAMWQKVIALDPGQKSAVEPLIEMAKSGKNPFGKGPVVGGATGSAPAGGAGPMSGGPMSGGPMSGGDAAPTASDISGTITCPSCANAPMLFVYLRPAGQTAGPPAAVRVYKSPSFPLDFRLGPANSPMGGAFPDDGTLTVRVDLDGNPTTHDAGAPEGTLEHVKPGQSGIALGLAP